LYRSNASKPRPKLDAERKAPEADGAEKEAIKKAGAAWYKTMSSDSDYLEFEIFQKWLGSSLPRS
jgi:large subunit ribosomal protein L4e